MASSTQLVNAGLVIVWPDITVDITLFRSGLNHCKYDGQGRCTEVGIMPGPDLGS